MSVRSDTEGARQWVEELVTEGSMLDLPTVVTGVTIQPVRPGGLMPILLDPMTENVTRPSVLAASG
jgi:hypothetical protein